MNIAQKTHERFVEEYLSDTIFVQPDATKISLRKKPLKVEKEEKPKNKDLFFKMGLFYLQKF